MDQVFPKQFLDLSYDFSGAEIEQAIVEGMYFAFQQEREFETADVRFGLAQVIPLAQINKELFAFYQYKAIYTYLKNENIALDDLANYFLNEGLVTEHDYEKAGISREDLENAGVDI